MRCCWDALEAKAPCSAPAREIRRRAGMVPVPREHPSSTSNLRDPSSELTGQLSCMSTPQRALNSWLSSRARQLTKDHQSLGACSPRETHMKEPTSTHKLSSYVLLVGMPICTNAGKQDHASLKTTPRHKRLSRELTPSSRRKRLSREPAPSPRQKTPRQS